MKVSVIVPVYNVEKYVDRAIKSLLDQSLDNIEIIVINDGSTDGSLEKIQMHASCDDRISIINKENGGVSSARNAGLDFAKGDFIFFLDGDDWIESSCLEELVLFCNENNADVVITDFYLDYDNGNVVVYKDMDATCSITSDQYLEMLFNGYGYPCVWGKLYRSKLFENVRFPEGVSLGEDLAVMIQVIIQAKKIKKYYGVFYHYIQNPLGITGVEISKKIYQLFFVFEIVESQVAIAGMNKLLPSFRKYKFNHIVNFVTSKPFWGDSNYELGFDAVFKFFKDGGEIPKNITCVKRVILNLLIAVRSRFFLKLCINVIELAKNIKKLMHK